MVLTVSGWAEVLKGTWVIDLVPSIQYMQTSPKWTDQTATHLPPILQRMSQVMCEFTDDSMVMSIRGKKKILPVSLKSTQANVIIFERAVGDQPTTLTVTLMNGTNINIRSSISNDLDFYLWKRGRVTKEVAASDVALALELALRGNEDFSDTPPAQWMSGKWGIGWRVYAGNNKYAPRT